MDDKIRKMKRALSNKNFQKIFLVFIFSFLIFSILPRLFYLKYWHPLDSYKIFWLNFLGSNYKLPLETPKPLIAFIAGVISPKYIYLLECIFCALLVVCFVLLSKRIVSSISGGIIAAVLFFFCNADILANYIFECGWPFFYLPLVFSFVLFFIKKYYTCAALTLFLASLIRPEGWLYTPFFLWWLKAVKGERLKIIYFLPAIAPLIWMFFDWRISGDIFYSYHLTKNYVKISGFSPTSFNIFWLQFAVRLLANNYHPLIFICGLIGIGYYMKDNFRKDEGMLFIVSFTPLLFYWFFTLFKKFFLFLRFFLPFIALIHIFAGILFYLIFKNKYLKVIFSFLLLAISFKTENIEFSFKKRIKEEIKRETTLEIERFLKKYLKSHPVKGKIMVGRNMSKLSLALGEEFSKKTILFREIGTNPKLLKEVPPGLAIYQVEDTAGTGKNFKMLKKAKIIFIKDCVFIPIFITSNREGIVYRVYSKKLYFHRKK